ncbi:LysM peptidoglycan-binding domain-containing protein [Terriglobus albidus]|uniref:LysM peptidoglycan-binding domain-containing protein n=1 Tax=Terriglobus albidus TaxID=1592106 RepID=A0A5B9EDE3_9BACT|nr:LysM peptidoglycan-binding domain-containing protein [Terriglobus albidus]QEE29664.1 LysM peptidoglycan-binding domain-containing protein [Terriglobus albidus]
MGIGNPVTGYIDQSINSDLGDKPTAISKMTIVVEKKGDTGSPRFIKDNKGFQVMFNPASLAHTMAAKWVNGTVPPPSLNAKFALNQFQHWLLDTLTFDLLFDTTEPVTGDDSVSADKLPEDVRKYTSRVINLVRMDVDLHRPPLCQLTWGEGYPNGKVLFVGHASKITQTLSYFSSNGKPLRATLRCEFTQWIPPTPDGSTEAHSADVNKVYVVNPGDTLASIARETLHDDALWRPIAVANHITDPLDLRPGRVLMIPTVDR